MYLLAWMTSALKPAYRGVEKAVKAGWEPVEVIPPEIEPLPGMIMEQTLRGMALYRMPEEIAHS
mgnify:CR=1 FL=1